MGCTGRRSWRPIACRASTPPEKAAPAAAGRLPANMVARRMVSSGTPAAAAAASVTRPSSAPWRRSPVSRRRMSSCSSAVARASSPSRTPWRIDVEPLPAVPASSSIVASRSAIVSAGTGAAAAGGGPARTIAHPTPIFPCRGSPAKMATAASTTTTGSAATARNRAAIAATLVDRALVEATWRLVATSSERSTVDDLARPRRR